MGELILMAMEKRSAGLLMFRRKDSEVEVFLVHPGGPFWAKKDAGAWMIPKGEYVDGELPLDAARREFQEETGFEASGEFIDLETLGPREILVRFVITHSSPAACHFEQSFSDDGGKTWELNWIADDSLDSDARHKGRHKPKAQASMR